MDARLPSEKVTIGEEKLSVTVTRKTRGDLLISQHSSERWFPTEEDALHAMRQLMDVFVEAVGSLNHHPAQAADRDREAERA